MTAAPAGAVFNHNPEHHTDTAEATWWIQATPGTSYARCVLPARAIGGQALALRVDEARRMDLHNTLSPRQQGPSIWQFPGNASRGRMMTCMKRHGVPVFVEVDDNYLVPNRTAPGVESAWKAIQRPGEPEVASRQIHRRIVEELADGVLVSTPHLRRAYSRVHENVHVVPNMVDPDDWPEPDKPDDGVFRVGYAFSTSHYYDFELILDSLEYAASQPSVEVVMLGLPHRVLRFRYTNIAWCDSLIQYRDNLGVLDLGVAPVVSNDWADARSDIKALEYTMAGAATLMSPTESYLPWFELGDSACFFPERNDRKRWLREMKWILANRDAVSEAAAAAKRYVLENRTLVQGAPVIREALESVS